MVASRYTGYEDKTVAQMRSETLNIAERAAIGTREIRSLVRIVAELTARVAELEGRTGETEEAPPPEVNREFLARL